jgi:DNA/RNA-binding protein KIN17
MGCNRSNLQRLHTNGLFYTDSTLVSLHLTHISQRCHTRLNGTRWVTLDEFAIYLGESGKAKVENRAPPGREARWFVKYIDKDPETLIKEKKEKAMLTDAEREQLELEKRVKLVQEAEKEKEKKDAPTELNLEKAKEIKFTLNVTKPATNHNSAVAGDAKRKFGSVDDDETDEKVDKKIKKTKPDTWLVKGIVVKVLSKSVGDGKYYKQKGE